MNNPKVMYIHTITNGSITDKMLFEQKQNTGDQVNTYLGNVTITGYNGIFNSYGNN